MTAASHMTKEGCQYLLASAIKHDIDLHILGYKDRYFGPNPEQLYTT